MPFDRKEYMRQYRIDHKEKIRTDRLKYDEENKEKISEYRKKYNETYICENAKENQKKYNLSEKGIKSRKITSWKSQGLKSDNYEEIYERYKNTEECDNCGIELNQDGATTKVMDHSHITGEFRNILCISCNNKRG
tara:strand:+ start:42 stop:449 length:408 start_codon:yes stop_codon:yes gene_type:complete